MHKPCRFINSIALLSVLCFFIIAYSKIEIVDFNKLNLYSNNVEWSGKITELDVEFYYSIGETNGVYINGTMTKIDDDYLEFLNKLRQYYEKFKSKWSKVIASRKKTPEA